MKRWVMVLALVAAMVLPVMAGGADDPIPIPGSPIIIWIPPTSFAAPTVPILIPGEVIPQ